MTNQASADPALGSQRISSRRVGAGLAVVFQLAWKHGSRSLRHPLTLAGAILSLLLVLLLSSDRLPVLEWASIGLAGAVLPLAASALLVANVDALRSRLDGSEEAYSSTPTTVSERTLGFIFAVAAPMLLAVAIVSVGILYLVALGGFGEILWSEVAAAPLIVALGGALGVALAGWTTSLAAGPLVLVVLALLHGPGTISLAPRGDLRWLRLWVAPMSEQIPPGLMTRFAEAHLIYLAGLVVGIAALALVGAQMARLHILWFVIAGILIAGGVTWQSISPTQEQVEDVTYAVAEPRTIQECRNARSASFCFFEPFGVLVDEWVRPVEGVQEQLPRRLRGERVVLRQQLDDAVVLRQVGIGSAPTVSEPPADAYLPMAWGRGEDRGEAELLLGLEVARWAVGLPAEPVARGGSDAAAPRSDDDTSGGVGLREPCSAGGQAREVVALWLAGRSTTASARALSELGGAGAQPSSGQSGSAFSEHLQSSPYAPTTPGVWWSRSGVAAAADLLERSSQEVAHVVADRWAHWRKPTTTLGELLVATGLEDDAQDDQGTQAPRDRSSLSSCR